MLNATASHTPAAQGSFESVPPLAHVSILASAVESFEDSRRDAIVNLQRWWKHRHRHNHKRTAELSELLRKHAEDIIQKKRQARIRAKIRDIVLHIIFLYAYTVSCHHGYSREHLYRLVSATSLEYLTREFVAVVGVSKTFEQISSPTEFHAWLRGPFVSLSYSASASSSNADSFVANHVVGAIRIGQLRVKQSNCTTRVSAYFYNATRDDDNESHDLYCYGSFLGDFSIEDESTTSFGGSGSEFVFEGFNMTSTSSERSEFFSSTMSYSAQRLPAPAFSVLLPRDDEVRASQILRWLENNAYVDEQTRVAMVDLNLFNAMLQYTVALRFMIEFPSSGGAVATLRISPAPLTKSFLISSDEAWWTLCNLGVVGFYVYFLISEIALQTNRRRRRLALQTSSGKALRWSRRNGSILRVLSLALYFTVWILRLFTLLKLPTSFPLFKSNEFVRLRPFSEAFRISQYLLGLNTCLCWWILLLLLRVLTHVDLFVRTVENASPRLLTLLFCLGILLYGYASAFLVVAGAESSRFRSIPQAMSTLLLLLFGSSSVSASTSFSTVEMLLFACFLLLNVFIISNLFLAVIFDAYRRSQDQVEQLRQSNDQFNLPLETLHYCRAGFEGVRDLVISLWVHYGPKSKLPLGDKFKQLSIVHAMSTRSKMLAGKADALTRLGDKLVQNVAMGLGDGNRDLLIELNTTSEDQTLGSGRLHGTRRRRRDHQSTKLLQGMLLQLAVQNDTLQRTIEDLRRELKQQQNVLHSSLDNGVGSATITSRQTGRSASSSQLRNRAFALNRPDHDEDDDDDDVKDGDEVRVVESPAELTTIQPL